MMAFNFSTFLSARPLKDKKGEGDDDGGKGDYKDDSDENGNGGSGDGDGGFEGVARYPV